jgi:hypothetical protein
MYCFCVISVEQIYVRLKYLYYYLSVLYQCGYAIPKSIRCCRLYRWNRSITLDELQAQLSSLIVIHREISIDYFYFSTLSWFFFLSFTRYIVKFLTFQTWAQSQWWTINHYFHVNIWKFKYNYELWIFSSSLLSMMQICAASMYRYI